MLRRTGWLRGSNSVMQWICILTLAVILSGCTRQETPSAKADPPKPVPAAKPEPQVPAGCVRGEPEQLLKANSVFKRTSAGEAIETVQMDGPFDLTIHHFGC